MAKDLIIVESPTKAKTIGKFLKGKYNIKASMGHIRDLPKKTIGVDIEKNFKPKYVSDTRQKKIVKELKTAVKEAETIYLASDHDREGEAIAWHLVESLKKEIKDKNIYRIIFNQITKDAIRKAISNPTKIDQNKVNSQQARRILERLVGYNVSPFLWKVITKSLSAGRVQSVALRIICEREDEIQKFEPKEYWKIEANLNKNELASFKAILTKIDGKKAELSNKEEADKIFADIKKNEFILQKIVASKRKVSPLPPYITSTLQQDASRVLGYSPKRTMSIAQQLYEGINIAGEAVGLITYMRTDSLRVASEAIASCRKLISERFGEKELSAKTTVFKSKKSAQDAHEAIRPSSPFRTPESIADGLSKEQLKLYTLIWQRFVATQMNPILLNSTKLEIAVSNTAFEAKGSTILEKGFSKVYPHSIIILGENIDKNYVEKDALNCQKLDALQKFTKPPARFTEASLIKELESNGIGRPSTYANITSTIRLRNYVLLIQRKFHPTDLGMTVNKFLVSNFASFFNVEFTAEMEDSLDKVEIGDTEWHELLKKYFSSLSELMENVDLKKAKQNLIVKTEHKCDKCDSEMILKWGRNGQFLACSNFPECKNIKNFKKDENGKIKIVEPEKLDEKCPQCESDLIIKTGRFGKFIACSDYPTCKFAKPFTIGIKCPDCEDGEITEKKSKKGKFYSCTNYPKCKFITNFKPVKLSCPECGHYYLEEHPKNIKKCPKCGKKVV